MTHTKGPWEAKDFEVRCVPSGDLSGHLIAECGNSWTLKDEAMAANARLIAAAPDTFEGCQLLESLCAWLLHRFGPDSPEGREATFRLERARAAILKAQQGGE